MEQTDLDWSQFAAIETTPFSIERVMILIATTRQMTSDTRTPAPVDAILTDVV